MSSFNSFSSSACFLLFELPFLFKLFSLSSKFVFFFYEVIFLDKFACDNLEVKCYGVNLLNS